MDLEYISEYRIQGMLNRAVLLCILIELFCYAYCFLRNHRWGFWGVGMGAGDVFVCVLGRGDPWRS